MNPLPDIPTLQSRRSICVTRRFSVEERVYHRPGDHPTTRAVVVHPGAVVILPLLNIETLLMIRQFRHAPQEELLELPAGTIEPEEPPLQTAHRELIEETGYRAATMERFMDFYTSPGILTERMQAFLAGGLEWVGTNHDEGEVIAAVEAVPVLTARKMLLEGEIHDAKTIAVLATYLARSSFDR